MQELEDAHNTRRTTIEALVTHLSRARSAFTESLNISSDHLSNLSRRNSSRNKDVPSNRGRSIRGVIIVIRTFMLQLFAGSLDDSSATNSTTPLLLRPETDCHRIPGKGSSTISLAALHFKGIPRTLIVHSVSVPWYCTLEIHGDQRDIEGRSVNLEHAVSAEKGSGRLTTTLI